MFKKKFDPALKDRVNAIIEPVVITVKKFDDAGVDEFRKKINESYLTGQPVLPVIIDSYGGSVYGCLDMVSQIQACALPVYTIILGKAMSAGAILFSMGKKRYMAENATIMLHEVSAGAVGKLEDIKISVEHTSKLNKVMFGLLDENCGQKKNYFTDLIGKKKNTDVFLGERCQKT